MSSKEENVADHRNDDDDQDLAVTIPRGLLCSDLPLDCVGLTKRDFIRMCNYVLRNLPPPVPQLNVQFDTTVHRKVEHFVLIFRTANEAEHVWKHLLQQQQQQQQQQQSEDWATIAVPFEILASQRKQSKNDDNNDDDDDENAEEQPDKSGESRVVTVRFSPSAGKIRDHFFTDVPFALRSKLALDSTSVYSLTASRAANLMAKIALLPFELFARSAASSSEERRVESTPPVTTAITVLDAFACVGGNTFGFLRSTHSRRSVSVTACELDLARVKMLHTNLALLRPIINGRHSAVELVHTGCALEFIARSAASKSNAFDIVFFDPPWSTESGANYSQKQQQQQQQFAFPSFPVSAEVAKMFVPLLEAKSGDDDDTEKLKTTVQISFDDLILSLLSPRRWKKQESPLRHFALVVCVKIPQMAEPWLQRIVEEVVSEAPPPPPEEGGSTSTPAAVQPSDERTFPFLFNFGARTRLAVFIRNSHDASSSSSSHGLLCNAQLDSLCAAFWALNAAPSSTSHENGCGSSSSSSGGGARELKPRFYDFEKKRWIELKKWIPTAEHKPKVAPGPNAE